VVCIFSCSLPPDIFVSDGESHVVLHAVTAYVRGVAEPGREALDERRLADAGRTRHLDDGLLAATGAIPCLPQTREFRGAAHELRGAEFLDFCVAVADW
jgi:hypothetical protein